MRIQFCGADRTVTGTCHMLEVNGVRLLLDMGMYQGPREEARRINQWLPPGAASANAVILSHGHFDHCGKLPVLAKGGFTGPIYCTSPTAEVARIVLEDAAAIQAEDAQYLNRRTLAPGQPPIRPLFEAADAHQVMRLIKRVNYNQPIDLGHDVAVTLLDAGHILGSAYIQVQWKPAGGQTKRTLLFTADIGRYNTPIIPDPAPIAAPVDYVITESTYGGKSHGPIDQVGPQLLDAIKAVIARRGRLLIPAFAVGRTQTMLWYVQRFIQDGLIPEIPIFVDSPMGVEVSKVHSQFRDYYDQETRDAIGKKDLFGMSRVTFASSMEQSKQINNQSGPCVIIASSPTCEFGRILHHLKLSVERKNDVVIFVGWTPPNTLGRRLQDGQKRVRILDRWYDVACDLRTIHGLSAHADGDEILRFLKPTIGPQTQFYVVHGEIAQAEALAGRLVQAGAGRAVVPAKETAVITL